MHYSQFLPLCRTHGVGFDVRQKQGTILTLLESHQHEHIGMITIGDTAHSTMSSFLAHLTALCQLMATVNNSSDQRTNLLVMWESFILQRTCDSPFLLLVGCDRWYREDRGRKRRPRLDRLVV